MNDVIAKPILFTSVRPEITLGGQLSSVEVAPENDSSPPPSGQRDDVNSPGSLMAARPGEGGGPDAHHGRHLRLRRPLRPYPVPDGLILYARPYWLNHSIVRVPPC